MTDPIMPVVEETGTIRRLREVSIRNAYEADHGGISYYDLDAYDAWTPDRKADELPPGLPWEITSDDKRAEIRWSEPEFRHLMARGLEILARWDARDSKK